MGGGKQTNPPVFSDLAAVPYVWIGILSGKKKKSTGTLSRQNKQVIIASSCAHYIPSSFKDKQVRSEQKKKIIIIVLIHSENAILDQHIY